MYIRPMAPSDLDFAAECTAREGWASETRAEFEGFLAYDSQGCFVAEEAGRPIGICVATHYGEAGFVGELIVIPQARRRGVGRCLLEHAVAYLRGRGARGALLDGEVAAVPLYERVGFRRVCRSLRFTGRVRGRVGERVRPMAAGDLGAAINLDRTAFGADRRFLLARRLTLYPDLCHVLEDAAGQIAGFILGWRGRGGCVPAGPWVVRPGVERPEDLLTTLAATAGDVALSVGTLETNAEAVATLRALGLAEHPEPPWRMALGEMARLGMSPGCYAVGSAAKG